jgi:predicted site-specific integrase-resolvase
MDERPGQTNAEAEPQVSTAEGASALGVDSFTVYSFIQRDRIRATRSPSGEFKIPKSEVARLNERNGSC